MIWYYFEIFNFCALYVRFYETDFDSNEFIFFDKWIDLISRDFFLFDFKILWRRFWNAVCDLIFDAIVVEFVRFMWSFLVRNAWTFTWERLRKALNDALPGQIEFWAKNSFPKRWNNQTLSISDLISLFDWNPTIVFAYSTPNKSDKTFYSLRPQQKSFHQTAQQKKKLSKICHRHKKIKNPNDSRSFQLSKSIKGIEISSDTATWSSSFERFKFPDTVTNWMDSIIFSFCSIESWRIFKIFFSNSHCQRENKIKNDRFGYARLSFVSTQVH